MMEARSHKPKPLNSWMICLLVINILVAGCRKSQAPYQPQLSHFSRQLAISNHSYNNAKWIRNYLQMQTDDPDRRFEHWLSTGIEEIRAGYTEVAIERLDSLKSILISRNKPYEAELLVKTKRYLALAHLRLGEQQNCIHHHAHASCILPIDPAAVHRLPGGSEKAIESYLELLRQDSDDHESRYLLNLAYMTLGQYPDLVPEEYLITNRLFAEPGQKMVRDIAMDKGLAVTGLAGGVIAEDFDQDGDPDLVISSWDMKTKIQYFQNKGNGQWEESPQVFDTEGIPGGLNMIQTDYNNDGRPDIYILRGGWLGSYGKIPNTLLRNDGTGPDGQLSFTDVTRDAGLNDAYPTQTAVWADFNNDGWLDVFIGNESAVTGEIYPSLLYLNDREGGFRDIAAQAGVSLVDSLASRQYIIKGVAAADYDRDGWIDLYISTRNEQNFLFQNQGTDNGDIPRFKDVTEISGLHGIYKTFSCWFWDYDNDGDEDLLAAGFHSPGFYEGKSISSDFGRELLGLEHDAQTGLLFRNNGDGTFEDVTVATQLDKILYMMGGNFGDIDNDGWLDFYCGNGDPDLRSVIPNRMFRFDGQVFHELTNAGFGHIQKGHGTAFADFDGDGDQDIYMVVGGFYQGDVYQNILLENQAPVSNNYIRIRLVGRKSNRFGVGSKIRLAVRDSHGWRHIYRTIHSGGSFGSSSFRQHIGLGLAKSIDTLEIEWAGSQTRQILTGLAVNQLHEIEEPSIIQ